MNLRELNSAEQDLLRRVRGTHGLIEEKEEQFKESGILDEYGRVFTRYVELIDETEDGFEALKRAIFLLWFEDSEPTFLTGIADLPQAAKGKAFEWLEHFVASSRIDREFTWMLRHYYLVADWVFVTRHPSSERLKKLLSGGQLAWSEEATARDFIDRGQMGDYWASLLPPGS